MKKSLVKKGIMDALPIGLGYFAVSLALGVQGAASGLNWFQGLTGSALTLASAGEYAGFLVIREDQGYLMMVVMTLIASARYFLMSCALSQKLDPEMKFYHRFLVGFGVTDEIFGLEIGTIGYLDPKYVYGMYLFPVIGWASGTAVGILSGSILPARICSALSVALYGMFIACIVPAAKKNSKVLVTVLVSAAASFLLSRLPYFSALSEGTRVLILTVFLTALSALVFPVKEGDDGNA